MASVITVTKIPCLSLYLFIFFPSALEMRLLKGESHPSWIPWVPSGLPFSARSFSFSSFVLLCPSFSIHVILFRSERYETVLTRCATVLHDSVGVVIKVPL